MSIPSAWPEAWAATADEMGIEIPDDLVRAFIGRPSQSCRAMLAEYLGGDADLANRVFDLHIELFLKFVETDLELKPGAIEVLEALKAAGFPLAIATSTARVRALPRLERFDMLKYFDSITCGDEIENGKPAPDIFVESARRLGCDPALCAVIEDSHNGVRSVTPRRPRVHDSRYRGAHARNRGDVHCGPADPARIARRDCRCERFTGASPRIAPRLESGFKFCRSFGCLGEQDASERRKTRG